ncbi:MAG TPA: hypothetical protein VK506_10785 [Conexibacter sp.]|nr:hypothetical protein [Conexibacter sp.]
MQSAASAAASVELRGKRSSTRAAQRLSHHDLETAAWLCALPCAIVTIAAVVLLGPLLGELIGGGAERYAPVPDYRGAFRPEPTEHARYLIALGGPLLYVGALLSAPRWLARVPSRAAGLAASATQVLLAAALIACVIAQYRTTYGELYTTRLTLTVRYFTPATLVAAAAIAAALVIAIRRTELRARAVALLRDTRMRRIGAGAAAVAMTAVWMLQAVHSDHSIGMSPYDVWFHAEFTLDEAFAILNSRTPLVDFTAQYGSLLPYITALAMRAFGEDVLTYTIAMSALSGLALLAIYGVLRRVTQSALAALLLYLPFLATSLFIVQGTPASHSTVGNYFSAFPTRYAGPFLLAWLTARRLERSGRGTSLWLLFTVGGLVLLNNADFGVPALGASIAAVLWGTGDLSRRGMRQLAVGLAAGLATAFVLVSALTLARADSLPELNRLVDLAGVFTVGGFGMLPIAAVVGLHLVLYATYVAAIAVATVRALRSASNRVLTGMLAWSGIFGLGSASYFIGRSHPYSLKFGFSTWALAIALLTVVALRAVAARPTRRPAIATVIVLIGFGVTACSLAQVPLPWSQIERLNAPFVPSAEMPNPNPLVPPNDPDTRTFVASLADGPSRFVVKDGAPVAILIMTGHRVADAYDVVNVSPYTGLRSMPTIERVDAVVDALRAAGGNTVILPNPLPTSFLRLLAARGFEVATDDGLQPWVPGKTRPVRMPWPDGGSVVKMVDTRSLHPRALQ